METEGETVQHRDEDGGMDAETDECMGGGQLQQCEGDRLTPGSPLHPQSRTAVVKAPEASQQGKQQTPLSAIMEEREEQGEEDGPKRYGRGR